MTIKNIAKSTLPALLPVPAGYHVRITHLHKPEHLRQYAEKHGTSVKKYITIAKVIQKKPDGGDSPVLYRTAECSKNDVPSRKLGRIIAHNRAVRSLNDMIGAFGVGQAQMLRVAEVQVAL